MGFKKLEETPKSCVIKRTSAWDELIPAIKSLRGSECLDETFTEHKDAKSVASSVTAVLKKHGIFETYVARCFLAEDGLYHCAICLRNPEEVIVDA